MKILNNREFKNAGWLISGKVAQMVLSLAINMLTARYLGPSNFGLVGYGTSYVAFFMSLCTLGINAVIIKDFVDHPDEQGLALGTSIILRIASSFLSALMILGITSFLDAGEPLTIVVVSLCSISLVFHAFDTINYWFQANYNSKIIAIATFVSYTGTSVYRLVLLILKKNVIWFALASSLDYIILGVILLSVYKRSNGPKLRFSLSKGKQLLSKSYHYILSGMMVAIYGQTDKLMIKQFLGEAEVGYYAAAVSVCTVWTFVLQAIIDSVYPTIINLKDQKEAFERKNRQLYAIVFYVSLFVSLGYLALGRLLIVLLYGQDYIPAVTPLRIITFYTAFSYLGVARNVWIVSEGKQKYLKYMYLCAAISNVILNALFIPAFGVSGAAVASLITQILTSIGLPMCFKEMRPNGRLMLEAIILKNCFNTKE